MKWLVVLLAIAIATVGCVEKYGKLDVKLGFEEFPSKYTLHGGDISPEIKIYGISTKVKSIAIIMVDPDAHNFVHWIIWNIQPNGSNITIPEGIPKEGVVIKPIHAIQGENDFKKIGYDGPAPPRQTHHYHFKVYGLDTILNLKYGSSEKQLENAMKGHIIQYGEATAVYRS